MVIKICQNPNYRNNLIKKYFVYQGEKLIGARNVYGIVALLNSLKPEKVEIDTKTFFDDNSLDRLVQILQNRHLI